MLRLTLLVSLLASATAQAQIGIFEGQADVGTVLHPGSSEYGKDRSYTVSGSGENMWFASDEFHFVWKKVSSPDVTLTANISIPGDAGDGHRKAVLMIRQTLEGDSAYVDAARHGDGLTSLQFRDTKGAITREIESNVSGPSKLRIEKQGDSFFLWIAGENEDLQFAGGSARVEMQAPFYVGIGVCAHDKNAVQKVVFTNVELNTTIAHPIANYSTVETVLLSGDARTGYEAPKHLTSAGWSADGHALTFEVDGQRQEVPFTPLKTAAPVGAPIAGQGSPLISPDGKYVLSLSHSKDPEVSLEITSIADHTVKTLAEFMGGLDSLGVKPWSPDGRRVVFISYQSMERRPTEKALVYGEADGEKLTMDYYAPRGPGPHPIAIIIHGGGYQRGDSTSGSEAYCADFLAPAGYAVFSINYRLAPKYPYPYMVQDVERSVRYLRHNAKMWNADPEKIALVGGSAGGFLSNMVGLLGAPGDPGAKDPVDRESAKVEAVVTLFAQSSFATVPLNRDVHALLDPLIREKGEAEALREASPITYAGKDAPPFLEILGDRDEYIPFTEATNLQAALQKAGVRCDIIRIPNGKHGTGGWHMLPGVPDWERQMIAWLNATLQHEGSIGDGIRARPALGHLTWLRKPPQSRRMPSTRRPFLARSAPGDPGDGVIQFIQEESRGSMLRMRN